MAKLHLTPTGQARTCTAQEGNCRYGKNGIDPEHYSTQEEAQAAYEEQQTEKGKTFPKTLNKKNPTTHAGRTTSETREQKIARINREYDKHDENIKVFNSLLGNYERVKKLIPRAIRAGKAYEFRKTETNIAFNIVKTGKEIRDFEQSKGVSENKTTFLNATDNYLESSKRYSESVKEEIQKVKRSGLVKSAFNNRAKQEKQQKLQELHDELIKNERNQIKVKELREEELS